MYRVLLALLASAHAQSVHDACVSVASAALAAKGEAQQQVATDACTKQRPSSGFWLASASADCEQFRTVLHVAVQLTPTLEASKFCSTAVQDPDPAGLIAKHEQCMSVWSTALADKGVVAALSAACEQGHGPSCTSFATSLEANEKADLNRRSLCDHTLVTGGSQGLDANHLQYSCVQFASNCAEDEACAHEAVDRCKKSGAMGALCEPFGAMVQKLSAKKGFSDEETAVAFCKAHANSDSFPQEEPAAPATVAPVAATVAPVAATVMAPAPASPAPVAATPSVAPVVATSTAAETTTAAVQDTEAALTECTEHTKQMIQLGLPKEELARVSGEVCEKKYDASICGNFTSLVGQASEADSSSAASQSELLHDACRVAISHNPFDMFSVCTRAVEKVQGTELDGEAFQKASFEVCSHLLEDEMHSMDTSITDGCTYFSTQLVVARSTGKVDKTTFCTQLTASGSDDSSSTSSKDTTKPAAKSSLVEARQAQVVETPAAPESTIDAIDSTIAAPVVAAAPVVEKPAPVAAEVVVAAPVVEKPAPVAAPVEKQALLAAPVEKPAPVVAAPVEKPAPVAAPVVEQPAPVAAPLNELTQHQQQLLKPAPVVVAAPVTRAEPAPVVATAPAPVTKKVLLEGGSKKVLLRKHTDEPRAEAVVAKAATEEKTAGAKASAEDEDFLNGFLDDYDKGNGVGTAAPVTLSSRVAAAFPENAAPSTSVDNVISDFLTSYDTAHA